MQEIPLEIIRKAAEGDIDAFETIYRAAGSFVYSVALRLSGNTEDADEITQDVFLKVYKKLKTFRNESSLKTWLYRVTVNTGLNLCERRNVLRKRETVYDENLHAPAAPAAKEGLGEDALKLLDYALTSLNPDQKTVFLLREIEGLSYQEIAAALKININTVRTRLKRARAALLTLSQNEVLRNEL